MTTNINKIKDYTPLIAMVIISAVMAYEIDSGWTHNFMGVLLCNFAMLKIFNLSKFADGFQMYDLLAKKYREYARAYPFLELALGLAYLGNPGTGVYIWTIALLGFSAAGVILALKKELNVNCACMGNVLQVPLSTVTLFEDIGMVAMASYMLLA